MATLDYRRSTEPQVIDGVLVQYRLPPARELQGVFEMPDGVKVRRWPGECADEHRARAVAMARWQGMDKVFYYMRDIYHYEFARPS